MGLLAGWFLILTIAGCAAIVFTTFKD